MRTKNFLILIAVLFMICASLADSPAAFLSPQEETELGNRFLKTIRSHYEFADYPYINNYINDLGKYLGRQIEVPYFPLNFYVIKENTINAFAAPGGNVFIFSGLIGMMENVDELASVLAHELGHVSARHLASRIERSKKIGLATIAGVLAGILVGGKATGALMAGSMATGIQAELGYSREDERQADQLGYKYAHALAFNPEGMITTLKKIQRERWYGGQEVPPYLLTHPGTPERMANIDAMLQGYKNMPDPEKTKNFRHCFPLFRTMVIALYGDREDTTMEFKKILLTDPESTLAHYGLGLILEREGKINEALDHFKIALREKEDSIPIMFSMGKAYQMNGQYKESVSILREALELSPKDKGILYLLALSLQNLELYRQASKIYERLTFLPPVKNRVYYNLGLVYGRQGKLALAHYNLGIYFTKLRRIKKAIFHLEKARDLAGSKPVLYQKIGKALKGLVKR